MSLVARLGSCLSSGTARALCTRRALAPLVLVRVVSLVSLVSLAPLACGSSADVAPERDASLVFVDGSVATPAPWERGANLVAARSCGSCHDSSDPAARLSGSDQPVPGSEAYGANLTPDPLTGIGAWSDPQLVAALQRGVAADGHTLCEAMPRASDLSADDAAAIALYLRSLPPVIHQVPASVCGPPSGGLESATGDGGVVTADGGGFGTRGTPPPTPGALIISEVMCDPLGPEPAEEWFELHNVSDAGVALRGLTVTDSAARTAFVEEAPDLDADGFALFVRTREGATMAELPAPTFVYGESIGVTQGVVLTNDSAATLSILVGDVLIDRFVYGPTPRRVSGASIERIEPIADGGTSGCIPTTSWSGDAGRGTPAARNDCP